MLTSLAVLYLLLAAVSAAVFARAENDTCSLNWLFIDVHYRAVDARPDAFSYGLFIGAGGSSQNQSLWPSISNNETRLATNDFCGQGSPANCLDAEFTHGHFGADSSPTFNQTPQYQSLDLSAVNTQVNVSYGTESLNLFTHFIDPSPPSKYVVANHPVTLLSDYTSNQDVFFHSGSLGLGPSSTLVSQLVDAGRIGRRVVGMYLGTRYPRAGGSANGSIVLGGYDAGRLDGPAHKYQQVPVPAPNASPFKVHVKQMSIVTRNGDSIALVTDSGFDGFISTNQYTMDLPTSVTSELVKALGASPANNAENSLQLAHSFDGNLTITLDDGYEITYPSEWISNVSNNTPFSASGLSANGTANTTGGPLMFGTAFLHHLYMTIDYDDSSFSLANAKVSDYYVQPQSLCPNELPVAIESPRISKFLQSGMIGALIGGIVGGIGLAWFLIYIIRKNLQQRRSDRAIHKMERGGTLPKKSSLRTRAKHGFVRFAKTKDGEPGQSHPSKRVSFTESDNSSLKGVEITVMHEVQRSTEQAYEMRSIPSKYTATSTEKSQSSPVSPVSSERLSDADTLNGDNHHPTRNQQPAIMQPLPTPNHFANPYAQSPLQTPLDLATPRTGNPLLGGQRGFYEYDDDDDSDLGPQYQREHKRTPSEQLRMQLGLKIDTTVIDGRANSVNVVKASNPILTRHKPAPLPVKVGNGVGGLMANRKAGPKTDADYVKKNPARALFGKGTEEVRKQSALRRMFPPPPKG